MVQYFYNRPRFRIIHDPSPHPISGERLMSKYEVQFGVRYTTFTDGTIIEDIVAGTQHKVVINNVFKPFPNGGLAALREANLVPPHPMIEPKSYTEDGDYIE